MIIRINNIDFNGSLVNGPGVRAVIFLQGCNIHCEGCHNQSTWDINCGVKYDLEELTKELIYKVKNKKVTISGGEPFFQAEATFYLVRKLFEAGFNICLYTGSEFEEVRRDFPEILLYLHYIKTGRYKKELKCTIVPYIGSTNQKFITLKNGDII